MLHKEVIYLSEYDIKSILSKVFNTETYDVKIEVSNDGYGNSVQVRIER